MSFWICGTIMHLKNELKSQGYCILPIYLYCPYYCYIRLLHLYRLGRSSSLLDKVANLLCKIIRKHLESFLTIIINDLEFIIDSVLVLRKKYFILFFVSFHFTSILPKLLYCNKVLLLLV